MSDLQPGDRIAERYELRARLGQGGFGTVWRAHHLDLGVDVALKVLNAEWTGDAAMQQRFLREVRASTAFVHEYAVQLRDFGRDPARGILYFTMDLVQGETLEAALRRGPLEPARAEELACQTLEALARAHAAGIVHRDLKPANVMLTRGPGGVEQVRLMDFGIAKAITDAAKEVAGPSLTRGILGTPAYMSPEQARGEALDGRADLYALGVVLYRALSGRLPITAEPDASDALVNVLFRIVERAPAPLPEAPPALAAVVLRALAKDPAARYACADAMRAALRAALEGAREDALPTVLVPPPLGAGEPALSDPLAPTALEPPPSSEPPARESSGEPTSSGQPTLRGAPTLSGEPTRSGPPTQSGQGTLSGEPTLRGPEGSAPAEEPRAGSSLVEPAPEPPADTALAWADSLSAGAPCLLHRECHADALPGDSFCAEHRARIASGPTAPSARPAPSTPSAPSTAAPAPPAPTPRRSRALGCCLLALALQGGLGAWLYQGPPERVAALRQWLRSFRGAQPRPSPPRPSPIVSPEVIGPLHPRSTRSSASTWQLEYVGQRSYRFAPPDAPEEACAQLLLDDDGGDEPLTVQLTHPDLPAVSSYLRVPPGEHALLRVRAEQHTLSLNGDLRRVRLEARRTYVCDPGARRGYRLERRTWRDDGQPVDELFYEPPDRVFFETFWPVDLIFAPFPESGAPSESRVRLMRR
ncbi:MAG: protein kinase [Planctomycetota bacterium]